MKTISSRCVKIKLCPSEVKCKYLGFSKESRATLQMPQNGTILNLIDGHTQEIQQSIIDNHNKQEGRINAVDFLKDHNIAPHSDLLIEYIPNNAIYTLKLTLI